MQSNNDLNQKKSSSIYDMPEDLSDAEDVTGRVEAIWERYDDYLAGTVTPDASNTIDYESAVFYAEAVYNAQTYNPSLTKTNLASPEDFVTEALTLPVIDSEGEGLTSEVALFDLLQELNQYTLPSGDEIAPISDLHVTGYTATTDLLNLGILRIPIKSTCVERYIKPTDQAMALSGACPGGQTALAAYEIMQQSMEINCPTTALLWHYNMEARAFDNFNISGNTNDYKLYAFRYNFATNTMTRPIVGSGTSRASNFWGGAETMTGTPRTDECLDNVDLSYWANQAVAAVNAEASHTAPAICRSIQIDPYFIGANGSLGTGRHDCSLQYGIPGAALSYTSPN